MDMIAVFAFVVWFWLLVVIYGDLFRRHDISGWGKALWVLALVLTSYFGIVAYLVTQGKGMAERNAQQAQRMPLRVAVVTSVMRVMIVRPLEPSRRSSGKTEEVSALARG